MNVKKVIKLPLENITITIYENGAGAVTSDIPLDAGWGASQVDRETRQAILDAQRGILYSMLQAHATAGIDVESQAYLSGVRAALDEINVT